MRYKINNGMGLVSNFVNYDSEKMELEFDDIYTGPQRYKYVDVQLKIKNNKIYFSGRRTLKNCWDISTTYGTITILP